MPTGNLKLYIFDKDLNAGKPISLNNISLHEICPSDILQVLYQKGKQPSVSSGGTVIWKMGRCIIDPGSNLPKPDQLFEECATFSSPENGLNGDALICIWEETKPLITS